MSLDISLTIGIDTGGDEPYVAELYDGYCTHNVTSMWRKEGIYDALYSSEGKQAGDVLDDLRAGLKDMQEHPEVYREFEASNGWGTYRRALPWLAELVKVFGQHPKASISVSK